MGFFWKGKSEKDASNTTLSSREVQDPSESIPEDLARYLDTKQSQLSDREFKELLRRQSEQHSLPNADEEIQRKHRERMERQEAQKNANQQEVPQFMELPHQPNTQPTNYVSQDVETYRRQNDARESALVNCSEIQSKFYKCLAKQTTWDRLQSVGRLQSDECTALADFFVACSEVQKKAFNTFDYDTLTTIEEMQTARKTIDNLFVESFNSVDDVRDRAKFNLYTKRLRQRREEFHARFGK